MTGPVLAGTTFAASAVECVEAATIVLAVALTRGLRVALLGTLGALLALAIFIAVFGSLLVRASELRGIETIVGLFLLYFGWKWLQKAIYRYAGRIPMRDEAANFAKDNARLSEAHDDRLGMAMAFQGVLLEGFEVAIIVVSFAATSHGALDWSIGGAALAAVLVALLAIVAHRPLTNVPENALKFIVGTMLVSLGLFWSATGLGFVSPLGDGIVAIIVAATLALSFATIAQLRKSSAR
uniref:Putative High-affinity Fe2+/Pb2+ permease n=1 Tax=mine drainage metagenome TaxID=410659 RepID=E6PD05_9ZZZZ